MLVELKEKYFESRFDKLLFNEMMYELLEKHYENRSYVQPVQGINSVDLRFHKKNTWQWMVYKRKS